LHSSFFAFLEGESEVFQELADEEIVALVQSRDVDKPDSDEDDEDEPQVNSVTVMQAVFSRSSLRALHLPTQTCSMQSKC
jgi:hypothetical protein